MVNSLPQQIFDTSASIQTIHIVLKALSLWEVFSYTVNDMKENKSRRNKKVKEK